MAIRNGQTQLNLQKKCSWRAGVYLANKMSNNEFEENERVLVVLMCNRTTYYRQNIS